MKIHKNKNRVKNIIWKKLSFIKLFKHQFGSKPLDLALFKIKKKTMPIKEMPEVIFPFSLYVTGFINESNIS